MDRSIEEDDILLVGESIRLRRKCRTNIMKLTVPRTAIAAAAAIVMFSPLAAFAADIVPSNGIPIQPGPGPAASSPPTGEVTTGAPDGVQQCTIDQVWCLVGDAENPLGWVQNSGATPAPAAAMPATTPYGATGLYYPWI
jgi:hypothetical protein